MKEKEIINQLQQADQSLKALEEKNECYTAHDKEELQELLTHLEEGGIIGDKNGIYSLLKKSGLFLAKVIVKNRNFVILKEIPNGDEHRISGEEADQLLLNDLVYAREFQEGVFHCTDYYKPTTTLKGTYSLNKDGKEKLFVPYLDACGKQVFITSVSDDLKGKINQGDLVEGQMISFKGNTITIKVDKLLVKADEVGSDISMIISEEGAPLVFPKEVLEEAKAIPETISESDKEGRTDFTKDCVVTIDGDDAHDFDDAVSIKRFGTGYQITVHIADVTAYVKPGHPLDDEAISRGTSIYVADRVVPMLPFELSNGICSLNPGVERLVLSVTMNVDPMGNVFSSKIEKGFICSHGRLTYSKVNDFFEGKEVSYSDEIKETLTMLHEASTAIRKRRLRQGALTLDSTELKFHLDENGMPTSVDKVKQGESEKMIEDLMVIANCSVARELKKASIPVLYRVHEFPPMDKLSVFRDYLKKMRLLKTFPKTENLSGARLNDFLASIEDENLRSSVSMMMLRALAKARYTPEDLGHFGLAEIDYCHFTSPIRRYPDDIIHRLVKDYLIDKKAVDYDEVYNRLETLGDTLSREEVRADKIQRESDDLESAKYMSMHIGETFHGKVVGMVQRGMFIETDLGIEGFLAYHCMHGDYFRYNEKDFAVYGKDTDISFTLGTEIDIKVLASNPSKREIDFATPEFYDQYASELNEEEREELSLNGIRVYYNDEEAPMMTGRIRFHDDNEESEYNEMNDENNKMSAEENMNIALESMSEKEEIIAKKKAEREDDGFRPSPEQWKEVDVIRAVMAKYPEDESKVIEVLSVMDISEEEYRKLLRFTKPREDRGARRGGGKFSSRGRGNDRSSGRSSYGRGGHSSFHSDRGDRKRSYSDHKDSYRHDDRSSFRKEGDRRSSDHTSHTGYRGGSVSSYSSDKERGRKGFHSHDRERFSDSDRGQRRDYGRKDSRYSDEMKPRRSSFSRSGYGRKK